MNNLIEKSDPRVIDLFRRLEKASSLIEKLEVPSRRSFNGQRFVTDRELRVSRRTLQEYRSAGTIPYYLICGKVLYKESEIQQYLEDSRKQTIDQQELV